MLCYSVTRLTSHASQRAPPKERSCFATATITSQDDITPRWQWGYAIIYKQHNIYTIRSRKGNILKSICIFSASCIINSPLSITRLFFVLYIFTFMYGCGLNRLRFRGADDLRSQTNVHNDATDAEMSQLLQFMEEG